MPAYELIRRRRRTLAIQVDREGTLKVLAPLKCSVATINAFLQRQGAWIERHQERAKRRQAVDLSGFVLGHRVEGPEVDRARALEKAQTLVNQALLNWWARIRTHQTYVPGLRFRPMKTRWGTFHSRGVVTLNSELLHYPWACTEYVVVHELCHAHVANHGPRFMGLLDRHLPDWRERRRQLRHVSEFGLMDAPRNRNLCTVEPIQGDLFT